MSCGARERGENEGNGGLCKVWGEHSFQRLGCCTKVTPREAKEAT